MEEALTGHAEAVQRIPNAVPKLAPRRKDEALMRHLSVEPGDVVVLHASNLVEVKRPLDIARVAELVVTSAPELAFVIVGEGRERTSLERLCREAGVGDRFRFTGWVEHARMPDYLNLADVVVMTSESEAMPLVYLEAQACGRALVASDIAASREVIVDGQSGLLFRVGDIADLAAKILLPARDAGLRRALEENARRAVRAHDVRRAVTAHLAIAAEVAGQASARVA